eukprot:CAMPEP_0201487680 /NCGR_PEP_ID=MMETSP0151_2-20130828/15104_1 /ASSEMBLY_ACC=CAM_ASM_000257 /TAXON_ID=200890 /ORGANISM="Paramoeba atlantica, Strain 621/1 / CCAP 1560/9" /LENGTH=440 /DNA_ID=CAMNT_0047872801 /DNA_START=59 /DNA_END=1381 /DNA_ORIENTATION=+
MAALGDVTLNEGRFLELLTKMIAETPHLQNNPPEFVPTEDKASDHVLKVLEPYKKENGGPIEVNRVTYKEGRGNVILVYRSEKEGAPTVSFVGSHLDVVPADPAGWHVDPFVLKQDGDKLYGRGTTDCLGHVALITDLFCTLAETRPKLDVTVAAVFIASEENSSIPDVGVDMLVKDGKMDFLKSGPLYWVDSADSQPCIGTAAAIEWSLTVKGRLGHSGLPHKSVNPIELAFDAVSFIQKRFYEDFPKHELEDKYNFKCPSSMKPTQFKTAPGSSNQIPPHVTVSGDIRLTPFYEVKKAMESVQQYVDELNKDISSLQGARGPSKYAIPEDELVGTLTLELENSPYYGIACRTVNSPGYDALFNATKEILGEAKPFSVGGSLPLVSELQQEGFDVQICGYGKSEVYHGDNEYCLLSDMKNATLILSKVIQSLNVSLNQS